VAYELYRPVATRRTFEEAVDQIAEAVRAGDLRVGDRLPSERELATRMRISRPTLREAIKVLAEAEVIEVRPGPGGGMTVVSEVIPSDLLRRRTELRVGEVSEVLEARRVLEPRVAQLAGLYATSDDFDAMQRTIDLQRQFRDDRDRFNQLDFRFHLRIARATRNTTIVQLMRSLLAQLEIARDMAIRDPHYPDDAIAIHERTLAAIKSSIPDSIDLAMDEHLSYLEKVWEEETGRARLRRPPDFLLPIEQRRGGSTRVDDAVSIG
jgi:GntR family transcriptional regulator, transcriptional repressor for pyruvate dehydrogenase complex